MKPGEGDAMAGAIVAQAIVRGAVRLIVVWLVLAYLDGWVMAALAAVGRGGA